MNHVQIKVGDHRFVLIAAGLRDDLAARIAEIALAVKFADAPRLLRAYAVDGADEIAIRYCMRRLLELPQIFRKPSHRGRRIENNFRSIQSENARALRKMPVIADVDADLRILCLEIRDSRDRRV